MRVIILIAMLAVALLAQQQADQLVLSATTNNVQLSSKGSYLSNIPSLRRGGYQNDAVVVAPQQPKVEEVKQPESNKAVDSSSQTVAVGRVNSPTRVHHIKANNNQ